VSDLRTHLVVLGLVVALGLGIGIALVVFGDRSPPELPAPSAEQAASTPLGDGGIEFTVKQKGSAHVPGTRAKLHLDDITGRQVLVSVTDDGDRVIFGPKSVRRGDVLDLPTTPAVRVEVKRLENKLAGGDFGEFVVRLGGDPQP